MQENQQNNKKGFLVKIIVPIVIVAMVGGLWVYKNSSQKADATPSTTQSDATENTSQDLTSVEGYFPLDVTEEIDLEELKSYGLPIIIDFGADSCVPCKEMAPVLKKLNAELAGKAIIRFVDVWKYQELAADYPVQVIPTQILIDTDGKAYVPSENVSVEYIQYTYKDTGEVAFTAHQGGLTEEQMLEALKEMGLKE